MMDHWIGVSVFMKSTKKKIKYFLIGGILGFGLISILFGVFILPLVDKKFDFFNIYGSKQKTIKSLGDTEPEAFIYWYAPSNSFGMSSMQYLNWSYWKSWLVDMFDWSLEASNNNNTWYDANPLLNVGCNFSEENQSAKITLTLNTTDAPRELFYRFSLACNKTLRDYAEINGDEWKLTLPANETENYTISFNWSDIHDLINSGKVWFNRGVKDSFFWFRIGTVNKIPVGTVFVIDPTFGDVTLSGGTILSFSADICGGYFQMGAIDGTGDNITVKLRMPDSAENAQCAIYNMDKTLLANSVTEEKLIPRTTETAEYTFNFGATKPILTANAWYFIVVWGDNIGGRKWCWYVTSGGSGVNHDTNSGYNTWPDPWDNTSVDSDGLFAGYCSYTEGGGPPENNPPYQTGETPVNGSTDIGLTPNLYTICIDNDSTDTMNATWWSNSSGSWVQFATNTSIANNTNITQPNSNFSSYSTTYWWSVNLTDGNGSWVNNTYYFTTHVLTWHLIDSSKNGSWINKTTFQLIDNTKNGSWMNSTIFQLIDSSKNGSWINNTIFQLIDNTKNGTWTNTTTWKLIDSTKNGSWTSITEFQLIDFSKNGSWINISVPEWNLIDNTKNGSWTNTTSWKLIDNNKNGSWTNTTAFYLIDSTKNGTWTNETSWNLIDSSKNGTWSNTTTFQLIDSSKNGSWMNVTEEIWHLIGSADYNYTFGEESEGTAWYNIKNILTGSYYTCPTDSTAMNISVWLGNHHASDDYSGTSKCGIYYWSNLSYYGETSARSVSLTHALGNEGWFLYNIPGGLFLESGETYLIVCYATAGVGYCSMKYKSGSSHLTTYGVTYGTLPDPYVKESDNPNLNACIYVNCDVDNTISGSWINSTSWNLIDSTKNGSWTNTSFWYLIDNTKNGSWVNNTSWTLIDSTINGSWKNTTAFYLIDNTKNGTWSNTTIYHLIDNTKNGSWFNISWKLIDNTKNGTWTNETSWILIDSNKNGLMKHLYGIKLITPKMDLG
jgi:hypothetical protein